jgi:hypothetical protein
MIDTEDIQHRRRVKDDITLGLVHPDERVAGPAVADAFTARVYSGGFLTIIVSASFSKRRASKKSSSPA